MDPALWKLMRLQGRGLLRRIYRGAQSPLFFVLGILIFALWMSSAAMSARFQRRADPENVRAVVPLVLLGVCLLSSVTGATDKAIAFTPGEVDMLFPGPFGRRQLLLYKLAKSTFAAGLTAAVLAVAMLRFASFWLAGYVAMFLALLLVQFLSTALVLVGQTVSQRAYTRGRRVVLIVVAVAAVVGVRAVLAGHSTGGPDRVDWTRMAQHFARTDAGRVLLWPFALFGRTMTAGSLAEMLGWAAQAALVDALLLAVVVKLDANYLEAAVGASQRRYERLRRARAGGVMTVAARGTARRRLPQPPFLGGAGPIAWRQLTAAARSGRGLIIALLILAVSVGPFFVASRQPDPSRGPVGQQASSMGGLLTALAGISVVLASMLRFDFRADLDPMETLKALPLRPSAVAAGQLVAPVVVLTVIHWLLLAAIAATFDPAAAPRPALWVAAALAGPFNLLLFACENLIFLLSPSRPTAVGPGDFQVIGRQMFALALRTMLVGIGAGVAAGFGIVTYVLAGNSPVVLAVVTGSILVAETAALVPAIGHAFRRFDPSVHMPA